MKKVVISDVNESSISSIFIFYVFIFIFYLIFFNSYIWWFFIIIRIIYYLRRRVNNYSLLNFFGGHTQHFTIYHNLFTLALSTSYMSMYFCILRYLLSIWGYIKCIFGYSNLRYLLFILGYLKCIFRYSTLRYLLCSCLIWLWLLSIHNLFCWCKLLL